MTIAAACRFLGDLLSDPTLTYADAEALTLGAAMDRLSAAMLPTTVAPLTPPRVEESGRSSTPLDPPQANAAGKPGQDRQKDILAAIVAAKMPLTRPELVEHMRLDSEGKLGANLAWMVTNNILINVPQRGYWPCGVEVPE